MLFSGTIVLHAGASQHKPVSWYPDIQERLGQIGACFHRFAK